MRQQTACAVVVSVLIGSGVASAAVYDESIDGDLLSLADGPTLFDVEIGDNSVLGTVGGDDFEDFIGFTIEPGEQLAAVTLTSVVFAGGNISTGFRLFADLGGGLEQVAPGSFNTGDVGTDYLTVWDLGDVGGSAPLGPGTYGIVLAEFTPGQSFSFDITVVPAPASAAMLGLAGLAAARRRR